MSSENDTTTPKELAHDWEMFPEKYATDASGCFILKKDGTPRKKSGRAKGSKGRGYNYSSTTKARMSAKRSIRNKRKRVEAVESKLQRQKASLKNSKELLNKLDSKKTNRVTTTDIIDNSSKVVKEEVNNGKYEPHWYSLNRLRREYG